MPTTGVLGKLAAQAPSPRKNKAAKAAGDIVFGKRTAGGVSFGRTGRPHGVAKAAFDQFGLATDSKYASLGPRCRENVARALKAGASYQRNSGTTEELVCFGEFLRRGFTYELGSSSRSFLWQSPIAGSIVDFEAWDRGVRHAVRPQNTYWHGHLDKVNHDEKKAEQIEALGYVVDDIWDYDSLDDYALAHKFDQFFGPGS